MNKKKKLAKVKKSNQKLSSPESAHPKPTVQADPTEFLVEKIIGKRYWNGRPQLRIKWLGYPEEESTWEPQENMGSCIALICDFEAELYRKSMHLDPLLETEPLESPISPTQQNFGNNIIEGTTLENSDKVNTKFHLDQDFHEHSFLSDLSSESNDSSLSPIQAPVVPIKRSRTVKFGLSSASGSEKTLKKRRATCNHDDTVVKRMHTESYLSRLRPRRQSFHNDYQKNSASTPPATPVTPKKNATRRVTISGGSFNKDIRKAPNKSPAWKGKPRSKNAPYGLERGLELDKVVHHFKMGKKLFLFVRWKGMRATDVLLLEDIIDIYPQHIIKYMESLKLIPLSNN